MLGTIGDAFLGGENYAEERPENGRGQPYVREGEGTRSQKIEKGRHENAGRE